MPTLYEYQNPRSINYEDKQPQVITAVSANLIIDTKGVIKVTGRGFDPQSVAIVFIAGTDPQSVTVISDIYQGPTYCRFEFTPRTTKDYHLIIASGHDEISNIINLKTIEQVTPETTTQKQKENGIIMLSSLLSAKPAKLVNGALDPELLKADLLYRSDIAPRFQPSPKHGAYLDGSGFLAFPSLSWSRKQENLTTEFIFNFQGDRAFYLGIASVENFGWESYDRLTCEICHNLNRDRIYYQYGGKWRRYTYTTFEQIPKNTVLKLTIPNNGDPSPLAESLCELFVLPSSDPKDWDKGELIWNNPIRPIIRGNGDRLMPVLLGANKTKNELLAVRTY